VTARDIRTVIGLSACAPDERAAFIRRFVEYAPTPDVATAPYLRSVVSVALARPSELLLALDGDRVVGRALVAQSFAEPGACGIGAYAVAAGEDACATTAGLAAAARRWAAGRGCATLYAPIDVNTWFAYRFALPATVDSLDAPRVSRWYSWEPSQPAEYVSHFRALGFSEAERYRTDFISLAGFGDDDIARHTASSLTSATRAGFSFARIEDVVPELLDELHPLCLEAFHRNPLFEPITLGVFRAIIASATRDRDISHSYLARDAAGHIAGFVLAIREDDTLVLKTLAVSPSRQRTGLGTALMHLAVDGAAHCGVRTLAMALVHAGNVSEAFARQYRLPGSSAWTHEYVLLKAPVAVAVGE
jgi:GNAT superfamily N-acetyltransferase